MTLVASLLVLGALLTASFQLVMLIAPGYREDLAAYVSRVAGQPVDIGGVGLVWRGLAPRLELSDITLYGEDERTPALSAERLRLGFGLMRLLQGDTTPQRVELSGVELFAKIDAQGKFSLRGLDTAGMPARAKQEWLRQLGRFESVRLSDCELQLDDARLRGPKPRFRLVDAEIAFSDGRGEANAELQLPPSMGSSVLLDAEISGDLEQPQTWNGRWSARLEDLASLPWIDAVLAEGATVAFAETELDLQGALLGGDVGEMQLRLDAAAVRGRQGEHEANLRDIRLSARLVPQAQGWMLDIGRVELSGAQGPWPQSQARIRLTREQRPLPARVEAEASYLRLGDLTPWLALLPAEGLGAEAGRLRGVTGAVQRLVLRWDAPLPAQAARYSLRADFDELALAGSATTPGFEGLSGEFSATENGGRLRLAEQPFGLRYAKAFAQTVTFDSVAGELSWARTGEGWDVQMPNFAWVLDGSRGQGSLQLLVPRADAGSPRIALDARFAAADVTRLKRYMPVFWPDDLHNWLDRAVQAGRVPSARLRINGEMAHFPFVEHPGTFALDIDVADGRLAFAPDWPAIEKLGAHLEFRGNSLAIRGDSGSVSGTRVEQVQALIQDLKAPQLSVTGEVQGDAARFYAFLGASPIAPRLAALLTRTRASGNAVVNVDLDIPLRATRDTQVTGEVLLRGVELAVDGLPEPVREIHGQLQFNNREVAAQNLAGQLYDTPVRASLRQDDDGVLRLRGDFEFDSAADNGGPMRLLPGFLRVAVQGRSAWQATVPLSGAEAGRVRLTSNLQGIALSLPPPMDKPADAVWPVRVDLGSDKQFPLRVAVELPERLGTELAFQRDAGGALLLQRARLRIGTGAAPHADEDGIRISGTAADLDPLAWIAAVRNGPKRSEDSSAPSAPGLPLYADLNVGRAWLGAQRVEGVRLAHAPAAGGSLTRVSGNGALGELTFREGLDGGQLMGRFDRLQFALRKAEPGGPKKPEDETAPADPARLPRLDLVVGDLRMGNAELGRLELRTLKIADGQRIEVFRTGGRGGQVEARGEWRRSAGRSSADLQFSVDSDNIDDLLQGFGYAPSLSAKRSRFSGQLVWPVGAPTAEGGLTLSLGEGYLEMDVEKGQLRSVEPGAGRVLGLINFWALPRRLTLDFRDVLSEGLSFDEIKGRFDVAQGSAHTDDLAIDATSLNMEIRGRVGLLARDYDQRVTVYPDVSAGVTLGALLLGGPAAGVLALLAQEVLDQPLDQVGQLSYHLTGSWDDPQVVRGSAAPPPPAVPATPAAGPARETAPPVPTAPAS